MRNTTRQSESLRVLRRAEKFLSRRCEEWFPVDAAVTSSHVVTETGSADSQGERITYYSARIEYEYQFQGKTHRSDRLLFANVNYPREEAEAMVERHPVGSHLKVYVDPDHPEMVVLEKGLAGHRMKYMIPFIVGGVFLVLGAVVWFLAPRAG